MRNEVGTVVPWAITCGGGYEERVGVVEAKFVEIRGTYLEDERSIAKNDE